MRGHSHCRAHRDQELGPRGAGAPQGNLNALKTGGHAHPLPRPDLHHLARQVVHESHQLPYHLGLTAQSIHTRTRDPFETLLALSAALSELLPLVADELFAGELDALLQQLPAPQRTRVQVVVWKQALRLGPEQKLLFLRRLIRQPFPQKPGKTITGKTIDGTGAPPAASSAAG